MGRAFFFGWTFHYIADLVVHPAMNKKTKYREGREFSKHPPQHGIYEGLIDRISITYWFLKNREKGIAPSEVIEKAGGSKFFLTLIKEIPNQFDKLKLDAKIGLQIFGKVFKGV